MNYDLFLDTKDESFMKDDKFVDQLAAEMHRFVFRVAEIIHNKWFGQINISY